jgi:uncharacterized membrane protein YjgN (DUF898 family)
VQADTPPRAPFATMLPFKFTGSGGEYFGIWFANVFFTVITLGIYSAWAKVRNMRYFYRNTSLDGAHFDYHAEPLAILKGRLLAVALFVIYTIVSQLHVAAMLVATALLLIAIPWVIVRALKFRFTNTSYRNVRMGFDGAYLGVLKEFILLPVLVVPTLGLLWPYIKYRQSRYLVANLRYGTEKFVFHGAWQPWFKAGLPLFLVAVIGLGVPGIYLAMKLAAAITTGAPTADYPEGEPNFDAEVFEESGAEFALSLLPFAVLAFYVALPYYIVTTRNLLFAVSALAAHSFESHMTTIKYAVLVLACFFIVGFTFGFGIPFAKVILARYKADTLELVADGELNDFIAGQEAEVRALGEEIGEAFDIDVGL